MSTPETSSNPAGRGGRGKPIALALASVAAGILLTHGFAASQVGAEAALQAGAQPTRIAVVNTSVIIGKLDETGDRLGVNQERLNTRQQQLDDLQARIQTIDSDLEMLELTEDQRVDRQVEKMQLTAQVRALGEAYSRVVDMEAGRTFAGLQRKIIETAGRIAESEGYDLLIQDDRWNAIPMNATVSEADVLRNVQVRTVLWASSSVDLTDRVLAEMNELYRAGGG